MDFEGQFNLFKYCLDQLGNPLKEFDNEYLARALCDREKMASTAVGGKAFPHTHQPIKKGIILTIKFEEPVEWPVGSLDDRPISIVVIIISPKTYLGMHLKIMSRINRAILDLIKIKKIDSETFKNTIYSNLKELNDISQM